MKSASFREEKNALHVSTCVHDSEEGHQTLLFLFFHHVFMDVDALRSEFKSSAF